MTTAIRLHAGDRVRMTGIMPNDPAPLAVGEEGTVRAVFNPDSDMAQIDVVWDSGRTLLLLPGDPFIRIGQLLRKDHFCNHDAGRDGECGDPAFTVRHGYWLCPTHAKFWDFAVADLIQWTEAL